MPSDVCIRFDSGGVEGAAAKVRAALDQVLLIPETGPKEDDDGVRATFRRVSWERAQQSLRTVLQAKGLPGTFEVRTTLDYGY